MAQSEEQKLQASLFGELEKNDIKVEGDAAEKMKENIQKDRGSSSYLGLGVHEVFIDGVSLIKANSGTIGIRFDVEGEGGRGDHTFWLSEKALPYTIENISRLVVHNTPEDKKAEAKNYMSNIVSAKETFEVAQKKLIGGHAYLSIKESKTQTYKDSDGNIKPSYEKNLTPYKPKEDAQQTAAKVVGGGTPVDEDTKAELPF